MTAYMDYLEHNYSGSFDITRPVTIEGREYAMEADFHSHTDKYVLVKKARIWAADCHEYTVFQNYNSSTLTVEEIQRLKEMMTTYMEPELARGGKEEMEQDHMYTYLSLILISEKPVAAETIKAVKRFRFTKYYKFYARGYSEGRIVLVDRGVGKVYTNPAGRELKKFYKKSMKLNFNTNEEE